MYSVNRKINYRLYPNAGQLERLEEMRLLHARVYNTLLEEHERRYTEGLPSYSFKLMCKDLTAWRANPVLAQLNAQSLQVTAKRVQLAFQSFFRRLKEGEEPGYPRFKSAKRYPGFGFKTHGDGWRLIESEKSNHRLRVSGVGILKIRGRGRFSGTPKTADLIFKQGKWYASITFEVPLAQLARPFGHEAGAFDWGLKSLLTIATSGGIESIDNPRFLKAKITALVSLQRAASAEEIKAKAQIGLAPNDPIPKGTRLPVSRKLKRMYQQVGRLHAKIARQRHDVYHKLANLLIARFGMLGTEELDVKSMVKRPEPKRDEEGEFAPNGAGRKANLNRSIHDAAPAMLLQIIKTKAEEAGSWFSMADTKIVKPTQRCYCCGTLVKKELDERWHTCPSCNVYCDRDENAARTLLRWLHEGYFWLGTDQPGESREETPSIAV